MSLTLAVSFVVLAFGGGFYLGALFYDRRLAKTLRDLPDLKGFKK